MEYSDNNIIVCTGITVLYRNGKSKEAFNVRLDILLIVDSFLIVLTVESPALEDQVNRGTFILRMTVQYNIIQVHVRSTINGQPATLAIGTTYMCM